MPETIKILNPGFDVVKDASREWDAYNSGTMMDDLDKAATGYAFAEGMQNRYWASRNIKEDIIASRDGESVERNRDTWNLERDYYLQWAGMVKAGIPIYRCDPVDQDNAQEKETARIINSLHKYHYKYVWNFDTAIYSKMLPSLFKGAVAYVLYYKGTSDGIRAPGKKPKTILKQIVLPVFSVAPAGNWQISLSECSSVICELVLPVRKILEMFPDQAEEIVKHCIEVNPDHTDRQTRQSVYLSSYGIEPLKPSFGDTIYDRELVWHIKYHAPVPGVWEKGKKWLILDDKYWESDLEGGKIPVEAIIASEKENGRLPLAPAYEGVSSQVLFNDLLGALRKRAYREANKNRYYYEDTIVAPGKTTTANGIELGDGQDLMIRVNPKLVSQGVPGEKQVPFETPPGNPGVALDIMGLSRSLMQSTMHVNAELSYDAPSGTPAELLKTQFTIGEKKLGPSQTLIESCLFRCWTLASELMQYALTPNDTFILVDAGHAETIVWKAENISEGMDHTFTSRIGVPTTAEAKVKLAGMIGQVWPQWLQSFDNEDIRILTDLGGMGFDAGADPEVALAEDENRAIQNNEIEVKKDASGLPIVSIKRHEAAPEQNSKLHMKILARLKIGKIWNTLTKEQKLAVNQHYAKHAALEWLRENKQAGMFGMVPRAEFDIQMWSGLGVEIPPEIQQFMLTTGSTYREAMAVMTPPQIDEKGKPMPTTDPTAPISEASAEPMTEVTTEPTTKI